MFVVQTHLTLPPIYLILKVKPNFIQIRVVIVLKPNGIKELQRLLVVEPF